MSRRAGRILAFALTVAMGAAMPVWAHGTTERVSLSSGSIQGNGSSGSRGGNPAISADGRFVAFESQATNLVPGDTNGMFDVFVRDRKTGMTRRVSVSTGGAQGNGPSGLASTHSNSVAISPGGRFVAFTSVATNLVPGDTNGVDDVFLHDRKTGTTRRVSEGPGGVQGDGQSLAPALSADGRVVAFTSEATNLVPGGPNGISDVFVRDLERGTIEQVSVGPGSIKADGSSLGAAISADGRFVAFESQATNLVPGDTNSPQDIFIRDRQTGTTERVSVSSGGTQGNDFSFNPAISAEGRFVAFESQATNLVPGDTNAQNDAFVRDRQMGKTRRVSVSSGGGQANGFVDNSIDPAISPGGRFVAFTSVATNLVPGDTNSWSDVFIRDRQTGKNRLVSVSSGGTQGNGFSFGQAISAGGRFVAFTSQATNLVPGDTNNMFDVFVRILAP